MRANGKFEGLVTGLCRRKQPPPRAARERRRAVDHDHEPPDRRARSSPGRRSSRGSAGPRTRRTLRSARRPTRSATRRRRSSSSTATSRARPSSSHTTRRTRRRRSSIQQTTTDEGKTVPFIVERVTGTANRGIYQFALLVDPTKPIVALDDEQPWNHKYVNSFGGACSVNYQQPTVGNQLGNASLLGRGFAVGTSSLNTYANQCNDIISAEALMMTKEILTERHGPIRYTIGNGGSAGTMQQHLITEAYPGLLDGIATSLLYEDHWYQVLGSSDCILLWRYFGLANGLLGLPANPQPAVPDGRRAAEGVGIEPGRA